MPDVKHVALAALLLAPLPALGGGYYIGDIGARGIARAGAFVASPDSILALHYNPAGLSQLRGFHAEASLALVDASFAIERHCPCTHPDRLDGLEDAAGLDAALEAQFAAHPVENQFGLRAVPFLGLAYGIEPLELTIALAVYGPHGATYEYGGRDYAAALTQPQRYSTISSKSTEANYQLGVALSPLKGLRIGGAITMYQTKSEQYLHIYANTVLTPFAENVSTNPRLSSRGLAFDIPVGLEFARDVALDWSLGASYEIVDGLAVGASVRGKRSVRADGKLTATIPDVLARSGISVVDGGGPIEVELDLPAIARFGVAYQEPEAWGVEVAAVYEGWSVHDQILIRASDVKLAVDDQTSSLGTLALERRFRDTVSLRAAADLAWLDPWFGLTVGYFYEPSAIPEARLQASTLDLPKHGLAVGVRTAFHGVRLDVGAQHVILESASVTASGVELPAVLDPRGPANPDGIGADQFLTTIGNGTYRGSYTMLTASLSVALDDLL